MNGGWYMLQRYRSPLFDAATGPGRQDSDAVLAVSDNYPRCDRHDDRNAEVYCQTCYVSVCLICATTRHLPTHHCLDIVDAVDECRSILARHASDLTQTCWNCLTGIEDTNVRIESIRSELLYCFFLSGKHIFRVYRLG